MALFNMRLGYDATTEKLFGKPKAKKFNYSSELNAAILEQALADDAQIENCTVSYILESLLIERYIPQNDHARHYVTKVLYGKTINPLTGAESKYGIREALRDIFENESTGEYFKAKHTNNRELVKFTRDLLIDNSATFREELLKNIQSTVNPVALAISAWEPLCIKVGDVARNDECDPLLKSDYLREEDYGKMMSDVMSRDSMWNPQMNVNFILTHWNILGNYSGTFRFLSLALDATNGWDDSATARIEFTDICDRVMSEWALKDQEDQEGSRDTLLVGYPIANGDIVLAPRKWVVVNPDEALQAKNAIVASVKNGEPYDAPTFVYFCSSDINERIDEDQRAIVLQSINSIWPRLTEVLDKEVDLEYGPNGGILNMDEFTSAPRVSVAKLEDRHSNPLAHKNFTRACVVREGKE